MSNPWGLKDIQPGSLKTISDNKLATFAVGQQKKSRFQKAREEAEERKRQEERETAKLYDSFVASFEGDGDGKTFVRGAASTSSSGEGPPGRGGDVYRLAGRRGAGEGGSPPAARPGSAPAAAAKPLREMDRMLLDFKVPPGAARSSSAACIGLTCAVCPVAIGKRRGALLSRRPGQRAGAGCQRGRAAR